MFIACISMIVATSFDKKPTLEPWPTWAIIDIVAGFIIILACIIGAITYLCNTSYRRDPPDIDYIANII